MVAIGGGLLVLGMAMVANSGPDPVPFHLDNGRSKARLYGGGILAGIGAKMLWNGLYKLK